MELKFDDHSKKGKEEGNSPEGPSRRKPWSRWKRAVATLTACAGTLGLLGSCGGMSTPILPDADRLADAEAGDADLDITVDAEPDMEADAEADEEPVCPIPDDAEITCDSGPVYGIMSRGTILLFENFGIRLDGIDESGPAGRLTITILDSDCNEIDTDIPVYAGRPVRISHPLLPMPLYLLFGDVYETDGRLFSQVTGWPADCVEPTIPDDLRLECAPGDIDIVSLRMQEGEVFVHTDFGLMVAEILEVVGAAWEEGGTCPISDESTLVNVYTRDLSISRIRTLYEWELTYFSEDPLCLAISVGQIFEEVTPAVCPPDGGACACAISNEAVELTLALPGPAP